jgi:hypothetical protein
MLYQFRSVDQLFSRKLFLTASIEDDLGTLPIIRSVPAARPRLGQPELFEAQRQVRRLSGAELVQGKTPAAMSEGNGFQK